MFRRSKYLLAVVILSSCYRRSEPPVYTEYKPVLLNRESLERSIYFHEPDKIVSPAKIYYKDNFIFISERFKGVHVIDNSNPANPINKGYIFIPGCVDMAIKENIMYVDNATDLVAINLKDLNTAKVETVKRIKDAFPELAPPDGKTIPAKFEIANRPSNTIIVEWKK